MQGGPHNHTIAGLACALKQAAGPEFKAYQEQVLSNCQALAEGLKKRGFTLVSGGVPCLRPLPPNVHVCRVPVSLGHMHLNLHALASSKQVWSS